MLKNNWKKKLIAMLLIFTLTFADFALVGKTYAVSLLDAFSNNEGDTGSANVEFDANFVISREVNEEDSEISESELDEIGEQNVVQQSSESEEVEQAEEIENSDETQISKTETEETKETSVDVNENNLMLKLNVKVSNSGYLKDGKIILGNGEELNFSINTENFENSMVQNFENNNLELVQMNADSEAIVELPIYYSNASYVEEDKVSKSNVIRFEGTYVDDDEEISVSKDINLSLTWNDNRNTEVTSEVTKYINYSINGANGVILQTLIKANNASENNILPVHDSSIEVQVPTINGIKPESVKVVASSLMGTTGKELEDVEFNNDNWNYDSENNKLNINVQNKSELVSIQNEDDVLIDETAEKVEAYKVASGTDEYLVTYVYNNVSLENIEVNSNIISTFNMFGNTSLVSKEEKTYTLTEQIGDIVTFSTETSTASVSKGYTYLNYNNEENKYEIEIDNKLIFNISYKDIVSGLYYEDGTNYYLTNSGEALEQNDIYYKSLKISQSNFNEILGEENSYINISDINGNILATINNETEVTEDGFYKIDFEAQTVGKIKIETSAPIAEGNLNLITVRAYKDTSFDKETYKTFEKLHINSIAKARYTDVTDLVDCGTATTEVKLENTTTNVNLSIGQDNLSTLAMNNNVELKLELNNDKITSDVFGDSVFTIKMPEYIETVEITDYNIVYGEGLEISNIEAYEQDGSIYLKITVTGVQQALSSGIVSNGTNIVLNANIKVDLYAPATTTNFELTYTNNEVTTYASEKDGVGYSQTPVSYSAPSGVISVNSISGYNSKGETVASVKQGNITGNIDIYSTAKSAKMELIVMNNEENSISNLAILGRTIFAGNKDLLTDEDLGTTMDAQMVSGIVSDSNNGTDFTIYYSENANANKDLNDTSNGWTLDVSDWSAIKSYLIVPNDSNYELGTAQKLHFTYNFTVPADLPHNEDFYGTFGTYYTNNTSVATLDEVSVADLVGITTGVGPELEINSSVNSNTVNEFDEFELTTIVKNTGEVVAKNVVVTVPIPDDVLYVKSSTDNNIKTEANKEDSNNIIYTLEELEAGAEITIITTFEVQTIQIDYDDINEDGQYIKYFDDDYEDETTIENIVNSDLIIYATVTADDLGTTLSSDEIKLQIVPAEMRIQFYDPITTDRGVLKSGDEIVINIMVTNISKEAITNINLHSYIDETIEVNKLLDNNYEEVGEFDESSRLYTWSIDNLDVGESVSYTIYITVGQLTTSELSKDIELKVIGQGDGTSTYSSKSFDVTVGRASLLFKQTTNTTNSYVKEGDTIEYVFSITNEGTVVAKSITLTDEIPDGLTIKEVKYSEDGQTFSLTIPTTESASVPVSVEAGETKDVTVVAVADNLNGVQEKSVTNVGSITTDDDTITSNSITHIIESTGAGTTIGEQSTAPASSSSSSSSNLLKTYNITGVAWVDSNRNGARDDSEELLKGIKATLVDSDSGVIKQNATTNSDGEYKFSGVQNGNYIVIFDYDTVLYTVTTYQKENVASNINSDVISTKIEQDGVYRNGAVTDVVTISDGSISNIDIGLVEAMKFDLSLNMGVSKITVQNSQGTKTVNYDLATYTKTEISQRFLAGSEIYVEYTISVKNEGEVSGYASSIVDYIPEGMNFNSSLNSDWYTGNDGNLYTNKLQNREIASGETVTLTLVLSKTMTNENTGTVSNTAEIASDYNIYGISDIDSTPGNNNQNEDDFARVDSILSVGTGGVWIYVSVITTTIILIGIAVFIVVLKRKNKFVKGGV